jgi:hypothetical protein
MSHATALNGATFFHNGAYSGLVDVVETGPNGERVGLANVPVNALEQFVAEKERHNLISYLEELDLSQGEHRQTLMRISLGIGDLDY